MGEREDKELRIAIRRKDVRLVEKLLDNGAQVNNFNTRGETPLHLAVNVAGQNISNATHRTCIAIVNKLLDKGAKIDIQNAVGDTSFHLAVSQADRKLAIKLLGRGGNVYVKNKRGETPMELSIHVNLGCRFIIDSSPMKPPRDQLKPLLEKAVRLNYKCVVNEVLVRGAAVDTRYNQLQTPLHIAAKNNLWLMFDNLIDRGADIEARDVFGRTPLFYAAGSEGASLHFAALRLLVAMAAKMIREGADVNAKNNNGETPLHYGILHHYEDYCENRRDRLGHFVSLLIRRGADIEVKTNQGETPLVIGFRKGNFIIVNELLRVGADFNALSNYADHTPVLEEDGINLSAEENFAIEIFKLSLAGLFDNTKNSTFKKYEDIALLLPELRDEIKKELSMIKETIVYENVSLNIIFSKYRNPYYVSNKKLVKALERKLSNSCYNLIHYRSILENIFQKSKRDFHMMQFSSHALANLLGNESRPIPLPIEVIHIIARYLDDSSRYQIVKIAVFSDMKAQLH